MACIACGWVRPVGKEAIQFFFGGGFGQGMIRLEVCSNETKKFENSIEVFS